jgi:hypothetical protein
MHPFTCGSGNRIDAAHLDREGVLFATPNGWICPYCDYRQNWAHDFMFHKTTGEPVDAGGTPGMRKEWANTICGACQILDAWKAEEAWTDWDRQIRNELTEILKVLYALAAPMSDAGRPEGHESWAESFFDVGLCHHSRMHKDCASCLLGHAARMEMMIDKMGKEEEWKKLDEKLMVVTAERDRLRAKLATDAGGEGTGPVAPEGMVLTQRQCIVCLENHTCFTRAAAPPAEPHKCIAEMQLPAGQGFLQCPICGATTGVVPAEPQEEKSNLRQKATCNMCGLSVTGEHSCRPTTGVEPAEGDK